MISLKPFLIALTVIITSCYFFPFVTVAIPFANSKMMLAAIGLVMFGIELVKRGNAVIGKTFLNLSLWAIAVSMIALTAIIINDTIDKTFVTYIVSMWVWLAGGYAVLAIVKSVHGRVDVPVVVNYLIAVCVMQCVLALIFNIFPAAESWHSETFAGEAFMGNTDKDRLHGIGCSLDVAGFRFSSVIVMAGYLMYYYSRQEKNAHNLLYFGAIAFITIVGNMISRSTVIGGALVLLFLFYVAVFQKNNKSLLVKITMVSLMAVVVCAVLYYSNDTFRNNLRFGFEGFFSLVEKGEWQTNSNDILKSMVVWPDNLKTWIIGDGYFNNPLDKSLPSFDPYYVGETFVGYYKGTDIGYLRYIFYFGVTGLVVFSLFFVEVCKACIRFDKAFKWMFLMLLAINFIQWIKVSTDLFVVFAPFLSLAFFNSSESEQEVDVLK